MGVRGGSLGFRGRLAEDDVVEEGVGVEAVDGDALLGVDSADVFAECYT